MASRQLRWLSVLVLAAMAGLPMPPAAAVGEILSIGDATVVEGNSGATSMVFTVTVSSTTSQTVSGTVSTGALGGSFVDATAGGSCGGGADFARLTDQPFSIPPNTASTTVTVNVCGDAVDEVDESFFIFLEDVTGDVQCLEGTCNGIGTIRDDEPLVSVTGPATNPIESATGTTTANFTATISPAPTRSFSLRFSTANGDAIGGASCTTAGVDYIAVNTSVTVNPGETTKTIPVQVCADDRDEPVQSFLLNLLDGNGYELGAPAQAQANIIDEDPSPILRINDVSAPEGQPCTTQPCLSFTLASFTVTLSRPSEFTVTASASTANGTAVGVDAAGCSGGGTSDYLNVTNVTVTFDPLQTSRFVAVRVCKDSAVEADETYQVRLSSPSFATCVGGDCTGQGTIQNDDSTSGTFAATPEAATVAVDEHLPLSVVWSVPSGQVWRDLDTIDVRIAEDDRTDIWVRWEEAGNTFRLCHATADAAAPDASTCGRVGAPGSRTVLQGSVARLHLVGTSVTGSGLQGRDVTFVLDLSFKGGARDRTFDVTLAARDDLGNADTAFLHAGTIQVTRRT